MQNSGNLVYCLVLEQYYVLGVLLLHQHAWVCVSVPHVRLLVAAHPKFHQVLPQHKVPPPLHPKTFKNQYQVDTYIL